MTSFFSLSLLCPSSFGLSLCSLFFSSLAALTCPTPLYVAILDLSWILSGVHTMTTSLPVAPKTAVSWWELITFYSIFPGIEQHGGSDCSSSSPSSVSNKFNEVIFHAGATVHWDHGIYRHVLVRTKPHQIVFHTYISLFWQPIFSLYFVFIKETAITCSHS